MVDGQNKENYCADLVRKLDHDRYLSTLFAPAPKRHHLLSLYAFNIEIARIREIVSEPALGEMRLQWWRDTIAALYEGNPGDHPVSQGLADAIKAGDLPQSAFQNLIDARVFDLYDDPMPTLNDLEGYLGETSSVLIILAAHILAGPEARGAADAAGHGGVAYGIAGLMRSLPIHRAHGQCFVPKTLLEDHNASPSHILSGRWDKDEQAAITSLIDTATQHLRSSRFLRESIPDKALPAFLPLGLVDGYLKISGKPGYNPLELLSRVNPLWRYWIFIKCALKKRF